MTRNFRNGNNLDKGGDPFDVKIQGPNGPVDAKIKDNQDGTYTVDYKPDDAGKHRYCHDTRDIM